MLIDAAPEVDESQLPRQPSTVNPGDHSGPRRLRDSVELRHHGYTRGCDWCLTAQLGLPGTGHSETFRRRN